MHRSPVKFLCRGRWKFRCRPEKYTCLRDNCLIELRFQRALFKLCRHSVKQTWSLNRKLSTMIFFPTKLFARNTNFMYLQGLILITFCQRQTNNQCTYQLRPQTKLKLHCEYTILENLSLFSKMWTVYVIMSQPVKKRTIQGPKWNQVIFWSR